MKTLTKTTSFRIHPSLHRAMLAKAEALRVHPSALIREAIASWTGNEKRPASINPVAVTTQEGEKAHAKLY